MQLSTGFQVTLASSFILGSHVLVISVADHSKLCSIKMFQIYKAINLENRYMLYGPKGPTGFRV